LLPLLFFEIVQGRSLGFIVSSWSLFNRGHRLEASYAAVVDVDEGRVFNSLRLELELLRLRGGSSLACGLHLLFLPVSLAG
jgi:hypothetical protein